MIGIFRRRRRVDDGRSVSSPNDAPRVEIDSHLAATPIFSPQSVLPLDSDVESTRDLKGRTVRGTAWTAGSRLTQQALQLTIMIVLARLLAPSEFGLVGMIVVFTGFALLFVDSGFGAALIQRKTLGPRHPSTAFWLNLTVGLVLSALAVAIAPLLARFYDEPRLVSLTMVAGLNFTLASLTVVQISLLERSMNFRRIAAIENAAVGIAGVIAVVCALTGTGVWSLVIFTLTGTATQAALLWLTSEWRPSAGIDREALHDLWGFGRHLVGANAVNYWSRNADNLLVGRFVGAAGLGIYSRAYSLMLLSLAQVSNVVSRTLFPALSRLQDDVDRVRDGYLRAVGVIALLTFPMVTGLFVAADPLIRTLLGERWHQVVPLFQILCLPALTQSIGTTTGVIYQSQGRTDWLLRWQLAAGALTIASFAIGIHWGTKGVAVAYAIRSIPTTWFNFAIPGRLIGMRVTDVLTTVRGPLLASVIAAGAAWLAGAAVSGLDAPLRLLVEVGTVGVVYFVLNLAARPAPYVELRDILRSRSAPRASRPAVRG